MHKNLFMSMSLNNMIWIIWYSCVLFQPEVWSTNPTWCRVLHVLVQYFMITTYSWMLCEGAYLQLLLMNTWGVKRWQLSTLIGRQIVIYILQSVSIILKVALHSSPRGDKSSISKMSFWYLSAPIWLIILHIIWYNLSKIFDCHSFWSTKKPIFKKLVLSKITEK